MKKSFLRVISLIMTAVMLMGALPLSTLAAEINSSDIYTLDNGFIKVNVSKKNGGFDIRTVEGDKLNKDDNNKNLLFPLDENDTSFTSFRVTRGGKSKDYIFGGKYSFLGLSDKAVTITQDATGITAVWGVDDLTFTQRIELANSGSLNHGMVYISYKAETTGEPADIKARVLMDTALGYQDYAIYEMSGDNSTYTRVKNEEVYSNQDGNLYEKTFFAYDDISNPTILAYTVNATINEKECIPEKVAFAHWNNLAASVYDFVPDKDLTFTNPYNKKYLTADSAYALYFDMGTVDQNTPGSIATNYGVYSNDKVSGKNTVAVNLAAPTSMELSDDKKSYLAKTEGGNAGDFTIQTSIENFRADTSRVYDKVKIAVYSQTGIVPVSDDGVRQDDASYANPYTKEVNDFKIDEIKSISWKFNASVGAEASYRKVQFKVYNVSSNVDPTGSGQLLEENLLGEAYCYILCPGGDGLLPEIKFTGSSPEITYNEGNRHLFLSGTNFKMLQNKAEYTVIAKHVSGKGKSYIIPADSFIIDDNENTIDVLMTEKMEIGNYQLTIDYTDALKKDIAAPAMLFSVSDDKQYKNDSYGVLAIIQTKGSSFANSKYEIKTFGSETAYEKAKSDLGEVLIELKGEFVATDQVAADGTILKYTGVSSKSGSNVMTVNNSIDVENGSLTVTIKKYGESDQCIDIDFDADLYTTGARTPIWKGISALTSIVKGIDYELIEYNNFGERNNSQMSNKQPISLIWPSAASAAQTIAGIIFEFRYGELGKLKYQGKERLVVGFGAMLDLSFVIPNNAKKSPVQLDLFDKINLTLYPHESYNTDVMRGAWEYHKDQVKMDKEADAGEAAVKVKDVLFGGEYIGFNANLKVQIPGYTPSMPTMSADLTINTIGDWAVSVDGKLKFTKIEMEASIYIKSKDGYPVPDKLYFFIKGFTPGVNIDGFGVVWLQGGGGGIDKLYDTIFSTDSIPPLKLLLSAQLSILQAFSARADLSLSLRGIGIKVSNGVIANTNIKVLNHAQLQFEWYPDFYFMAAVSINLLEIITGGGYIVVESDGFFEFYVKAAVNIPEEVFFIGGMHLGSVELGASSSRIWGGLDIIGIRAGICYYWGGDFDFGFGGKAPAPTYPQLLGKDDVPVYTDPETGRIMYMHVGTNFEPADNTQLVESFDESTELMDAGSVIKSKPEKKEHKLILGAKGDADAILSINFKADSKAMAIGIAEKFTIKDKDGMSYPIKIYNQEFAADSFENQEANANITYNPETKIAGFNITFTDTLHYNKTWDILTPDATSDLLMYNVFPMASLDSLNASVNGNEITASWDGNELDSFEEMSFMALKNPEDTEGALLYKISGGTEISKKSVKFELPDTLESGSYYLKATAIKDGELCETQISPNAFAFTNTKIPARPVSVTASKIGDLKIAADISATGEYDGYFVNIYEKKDGIWILHQSGGIEYEKDAQNISVGGRYSYTDKDTNETYFLGLEPGVTYRLGVSTYKKYGTNPDDLKVLYSSEKESNEITLDAPNPAKLELVANDSVKVEYSSGESEAVNIDTFKTKDIEFSLKSNQIVSGTWTLDNGYIMTMENGNEVQNKEGMTGNLSSVQNAKIQFSDIEDGNHMLTFIVKNSAGDATILQKRFAVDTMPPRLLLESPVNGGFFEADGKIKIKGITDIGTQIIINDKIYNPTVNPDGSFEIEAKLDNTAMSCNIEISAVDRTGNKITEKMTLINNAIGQLEGLKIYNEEKTDVTNSSVTDNKDLISPHTEKFSLKAELKNGETLLLNDSTLVSWNVLNISGSASVSDDGILTLGSGARGILTGKFAVSDEGSLTAAVSFGASKYENAKKEPADDENDSSETRPSKSEQSIYDKFTDIKGHWAEKYIKVMLERGLFKGVSEKEFAPNNSMTRGMFVTVMGRLENASQEIKTDKFSDVSSEMYYAPYVAWASQNDIINGIEQGKFAPNKSITREQLAAIIYRYAKYKKYDLSLNEKLNINIFGDYTQISDFAIEAISWCVDAGIMQGSDDGNLHPQNTATRAEVSAMLYRFIEKYIK